MLVFVLCLWIIFDYVNGIIYTHPYYIAIAVAIVAVDDGVTRIGATTVIGVDEMAGLGHHIDARPTSYQ